MDKNRVMAVLRQMDKFLKGQEVRFTEGLRIMKSKLASLQNSVSKFPQSDQSSCEYYMSTTKSCESCKKRINILNETTISPIPQCKFTSVGKRIKRVNSKRTVMVDVSGALLCLPGYDMTTFYYKKHLRWHEGGSILKEFSFLGEL